MLDTLNHRSVFGQSEEEARDKAVPGSNRVLRGKTNHQTFLFSQKTSWIIAVGPALINTVERGVTGTRQRTELFAREKARTGL